MKENGILCFKDINFIRVIVLNFINIICFVYGWYVIYYNNRINCLYFDGYSSSVYNEFCEVGVYGRLFRYEIKISNLYSNWLFFYNLKIV